MFKYLANSLAKINITFSHKKQVLLSNDTIDSASLMINEFFKKTPLTEWALRVGLAATYLYSGSSLIMAPDNWSGYLPQWFIHLVNIVMPAATYLQIQGAGELIMALILLFWFSPRWLLLTVTLLSALEFAGILLLSGVNIITFRDIGLFGAVAALVFTITAKKESGAN